VLSREGHGVIDLNVCVSRISRGDERGQRAQHDDRIKLAVAGDSGVGTGAR
jgi:hypothetical protein